MDNSHTTPQKKTLSREIEMDTTTDYLLFLSSLCDEEVERLLSESDTNSPQPPPLKRQKPFHSRTDTLIQVLNREYEEIAEI
jgi:hypothetical protein